MGQIKGPDPFRLARAETPVWAARGILAVGVLAAATVVGQPLGIGVVIALLALGAIAGLVAVPAAIPHVDLRVAEPREPDRWTRAWWVLAAGLTLVPFLRAASWVVIPSLFMAAALASLAVSGGVRWGQLAAGLNLLWLRLPVGSMIAGWSAARGVSFRAAGPAARGAILATALLAVFVPLLMSADAAFAQLVEDVVPSDLSVEQPVVRLGVLALFVALGGGLLHARLWPVHVAARPARHALGAVEARIALGTLTALFALFIAVQASTLFGGQRHVLDTAGLTYAEYARSGFAQLLAVAALTFAVLGAARRWAPGERLLPAALCVLTLVVCVSALRRLGLYEETYGFTRLRFCAHAALLYFAALFALMLVTRSPRALVALTASTVLAFALADPDRRIATHNLDRYERTGRIDVGYLMTLGPDATPALAGVVPPPCLAEDGPAGFNLARAAARRTSTDRRTGASTRCDPQRPTR
ncbi:DUF4153 domain-containing protein [Solirubrobacter soli]|uniref:DUF4153 domain-containing protein n=1 Tax=Solirubrobacter soli TaxID=363832 RepID=UPI000A007F91|nr:DUF4173 domain-containing protein [Solirubrobacter soli]